MFEFTLASLHPAGPPVLQPINQAPPSLTYSSNITGQRGDGHPSPAGCAGCRANPSSIFMLNNSTYFVIFLFLWNFLVLILINLCFIALELTQIDIHADLLLVVFGREGNFKPLQESVFQGKRHSCFVSVFSLKHDRSFTGGLTQVNSDHQSDNQTYTAFLCFEEFKCNSDYLKGEKSLSW